MRSSIASGLQRTAALGWRAAAFGCAVGALLAGLGATAPALAQAPSTAASELLELPADTPQPAPAVSDPRSAATALEQARRLHDEGRPGDALASIERALQESPSDARLRFLKGVILGREGRDTDAIEVFRSLTQDFPELPEPYNNLAALHAARGELDQARAALDEAIRALPSYALAHENLGDVHLRLAMRAWQRAAQLDPANTAASTKLKQAQDLSARLLSAAGDATASPLPGAR